MKENNEEKLRQELITYIIKNAPWHTRTELEHYSATGLTIFKAEIDARLAYKKRKDGKRDNN